MIVWISGVHSGPDPSPGVGIARSLRQAFPDARLIGVDSSSRATGGQAIEFDHVELRRPWRELDLDDHIQRIRWLLRADGAAYVSGLDVEIAHLALTLGRVPGLLLPPWESVKASQKPRITAASLLGMHVPDHIESCADPLCIHEFGRRHDWDIWVKGRYHDAYRARSWNALRDVLSSLRVHWKPEDCFIQEHVHGEEHCIAFAGFDGELLGAAAVEKRVLTESGKTWAASVQPPDVHVMDRLRVFVQATGWTGGGELEFVRTRLGEEYLFDLNPRFPAYIHGVTLCGLNLPGLLLARHWGCTPPTTTTCATQFARVVWELPVLPDRAIPPLSLPSRPQRVAGKHPSVQPQLAKRLISVPPDSSRPIPESTARWVHAIELARGASATPCRIRVDNAIDTKLARVRDLLSFDATLSVVPALSIKTMPDPALGRAAARLGWWAEAISTGEVCFAMECGFAPDHLVLNGPIVPRTLQSLDLRVGMAFADSVEALRRTPSAKTRLLGIRLRPPFMSSRFGVPVEQADVFMQLVGLLRDLGGGVPAAFHLHLPSDAIGQRAWWRAAEACVDWARDIARLAALHVRSIDFGGGWHADDFESVFLPGLPALITHAKRALPDLEQVIVEPGKAISADHLALVATIQEVRRPKNRPHEVVVDASVADLPMAHHQPHRVLWVPQSGSAPQYLIHGDDRILGCICVESDILASAVALLDEAEIGDRLMFLGAGAYNASMAWEFGRGVLRT